MNFDGNSKTTIITHYSPCEVIGTAEIHYADLTNATASIPIYGVEGHIIVTFIGNLKEDADFDEIDNIRNVMIIRNVWNKIAKSARTIV